MKKALLYSLSLALLLSLAACNKPQTEQQDTSQPDPAATSTPADASTPEPETPVTPEQLSNKQEQDEVSEDTQAPVDQQDPVEEAPVQLFKDCNETVYATGTVNIRASYTADSEKLGSLSRGQSVTRTGTSIQGTEAEGWSRVQLSDGSTAYISNKYLSTTKPEVQKPQQNNQQQSKPSTSTGTSTSTSETSKPSSSTDNKQTETPSVEQQKPSSDKTAEEKIADALAKAQAACDARGDGSYAVYNGGLIQIITPGGHMGSVELN